MIKKKKIPEYVSLKYAENKMLSSISRAPGSTKIHIKDSEGRILAERYLCTKINIPEENNSAVDGYAINNNLNDNNRNQSYWRVKTRETFLKRSRKKIKAIRIFTGAYLLTLNGLDTVYMEEDCTEKNKYIKFKKKIKTGFKCKA
jgi:molybdopterin biosynthesis enzyme